MNRIFWKSLKVTPALIGASLLVNAQAQANEEFTTAQSFDTNSEIIDQLDKYSAEGASNSQGQVTSVNQLSDVSPTDWAYEALRSLVERYGCIVGYPDRTFRGNRALSRYEFAAGLNACMQSIERLIGTGGVSEEDVAALRRLIAEFETELAALGARVDNLEGRVAFLEDHQFSTTTKLNGEVIMGLTGADNGNQIIFGDRFRLALETSFTGRDTLVTRLAGGNIQSFTGGDSIIGDPGGTLNQTFNLGENGNNVDLDWLAYYAPISVGSREIQFFLAAAGGIHSDYAPTTSPFFEDFDGGNGALSTFASSSPIYRIGSGAGIGATFPIGNSSFTVGYLAANGNDPSDGAGLFDGDYSALGQLNLAFGENFDLGLTYMRGFHKAGSPLFGDITGTLVANNPVLTGSQFLDYESDSFGAQAAWRVSPRVSISGFFNYTDVNLSTDNVALCPDSNCNDNIYSYGGGVAFLDLAKEGSVLGLFAGVQPYSTRAQDFVDGAGQLPLNTTPFHIEAFYKYPVNDNISITPGIIYVDSTDQTNNSSFIGTLRTTFTF
ncbi:iron uptake porin [Cyanobacterium stanieri LEGE 03274]|uniref:Iron uptake porin n=1 Tax=Cyanobacterium stanieri LEGE 03274 TaxID=1828756 RepID=A0ABR9V361_9CHRO|nr:iron uptake porin [Cyanobacterium stanieri]MBE9222308.1 iron uptake porin [Cyanobacterium stanieri LEGE 03274]